jgi:hypothetical protein
MKSRDIKSVCVPLTGSETDLIKRFIEYFSRKARKGRIVDRLFLEMNISGEPVIDDELYTNAKNTMEKAVDKKMFQPVRLSGFHISDFFHGWFFHLFYHSSNMDRKRPFFPQFL